MSQHHQQLIKQLEGYAVLLLASSLMEEIRKEEVDTLSILKLLVPEDVNELRAAVTIPRTSSADVCFNCHYDFGDTIGGRLRNGCPICQTTNHASFSVVGTFINSTGLHPALASAIIAGVIRNYLPINKKDEPNEQSD